MRWSVNTADARRLAPARLRRSTMGLIRKMHAERYCLKHIHSLCIPYPPSAANETLMRLGGHVPYVKAALLPNVGTEKKVDLFLWIYPKPDPHDGIRVIGDHSFSRNVSSGYFTRHVSLGVRIALGYLAYKSQTLSHVFG